MESVILEEINVKEIEYVTDDSGIVKKKAKPNFRTLGQKFGKQVQAVAAKVREMTSPQISRLQKEGSFAFDDNGQSYVVTKEDVEILHEDLKGWLVESDGSTMVALDTEITPELKNEGYAREFVNRVQNLRKDSGFDVTDRITISFSAGEELSGALLNTSDYITRETLALSLKKGIANGNKRVKEDVNGEECEISIEKVTN